MKTVWALFQNLGTWFYFRRFFLNSYEWLLREIKAHNCVGVTPRQRTQVCTPIQTDLSKFLNKIYIQFFFLKIYSNREKNKSFVISKPLGNFFFCLVQDAVPRLNCVLSADKQAFGGYLYSKTFSCLILRYLLYF